MPPPRKPSRRRMRNASDFACAATTNATSKRLLPPHVPFIRKPQKTYHTLPPRKPFEGVGSNASQPMGVRVYAQKKKGPPIRATTEYPLESLFSSDEQEREEEELAIQHPIHFQ